MTCVEKMRAERAKVGRDECAIDAAKEACHIMLELEGQVEGARRLYIKIDKTPAEVFERLADHARNIANAFGRAASLLREGKSGADIYAALRAEKEETKRGASNSKGH